MWTAVTTAAAYEGVGIACRGAQRSSLRAQTCFISRWGGVHTVRPFIKRHRIVYLRAMHFTARTSCFAIKERRDVMSMRRLPKPREPEHMRCPADAARGKPTTCSPIQLLKPSQTPERPDATVLSLGSPPMLTLFTPCGRHRPRKGDGRARTFMHQGFGEVQPGQLLVIILQIHSS